MGIIAPCFFFLPSDYKAFENWLFQRVVSVMFSLPDWQLTDELDGFLFNSCATGVAID